MNFDESLEKVRFQNASLSSVIKNIKNQLFSYDEEAILDQIESIHLILIQEDFQNELNENIFHIENFKNFMFLASYMDNVLSYVEHFNNQNSTKMLKIIKQISTLKLTRFLEIESNLLIRLLRLFENNDTNSSIVLEIVIELSANQFLGKIDYKTSVNHQLVCTFLNALLKKFPEHSTFLTEIMENLNKKSIEDLLLQFRQSFDQNENVLYEIEDESFFDSIKFFGSILNKNINKNFFNELFTKYDSFTIFERLLHHFLFKICRLHNESNMSNEEIECDERIYRLLRDLLGIIHRAKFSDNYLNEKILTSILYLYENVNLVKFFFIRYNNILAMTVRIFYFITMKIFYSVNQKCLINGMDDANSFRILKKMLDTMMSSIQQEKSSKHKEEDYLRLFLIALAFLQEKFKPEDSLLNINHYKMLATKGYIQSIFKDVSDVFKKNSVIVKWQFRNEFGQEETTHVNRLNFIGESQDNVKQFDNYRNFTLVDTLNGLKVIGSTEERRLIIYESFRNFFLSIIFHGLDVEKILCLSCLIKFCQTEYIRNDLFNDEKLITYLLKVKESALMAKNDPVAKRLGNKLEDFFTLPTIFLNELLNEFYIK